MHLHPDHFGAIHTRPAVPTAVTRWLADRRLTRRTMRQHRYTKLLELARAVKPASMAVAPAGQPEPH